MAALWNWAGHYIFVLWFLSSFFFFLWPPCDADADIIFLPCGFFLLSFFLFSSPDLSRRTLDVYHTCTHSVALVRIYDAGLKPAARGSLEMQDPKNSPSGHHRTNLSRYIFATKVRIDNRKKFVKQQCLRQMSSSKQDGRHEYVGVERCSLFCQK